MQYIRPTLLIALGLSASVCLLVTHADSTQASSKPNATIPEAVIQQYTEIAGVIFTDARDTAEQLQTAVNRLIEEPSEQSLDTARQAWRTARVPYAQSEVFRFGNPNVDDWEGQVNAWPLDEGLIDYVATDYVHETGNTGATANIIATTSLKVGGQTIDTTKITPEFLRSIHEIGGSEANVATGYHAIEFLLWGQDLNGIRAGAGNRPSSDFARGDNCTGGHCERRAMYLKAVTELLVQDLTNMADQWADGKANYRAEFEQLPTQEALSRIITGMGSLSLRELAGERMRVALDANSTEDEQDCFSDNTHNAHYFNAQGIMNVFNGEYQRDNVHTQGPGIAMLLMQIAPKVNQQLAKALADTEQKLANMIESAQGKPAMKFDQMVAPGNTQGAAIIQAAIESLTKQTEVLEQAAAVIKSATAQSTAKGEEHNNG